MLQITRPPRFSQLRASALARFVATWLLAGILLGVVLGPGIGLLIGLVVAIAFGRKKPLRTPHDARSRQTV